MGLHRTAARATVSAIILAVAAGCAGPEEPGAAVGAARPPECDVPPAPPPRDDDVATPPPPSSPWWTVMLAVPTTPTCDVAVQPYLADTEVVWQDGDVLVGRPMPASPVATMARAGADRCRISTSTRYDPGHPGDPFPGRFELQVCGAGFVSPRAASYDGAVVDVRSVTQASAASGPDPALPVARRQPWFDTAADVPCASGGIAVAVDQLSLTLSAELEVDLDTLAAIHASSAKWLAFRVSLRALP